MPHCCHRLEFRNQCDLCGREILYCEHIASPRRQSCTPTTFSQYRTAQGITCAACKFGIIELSTSFAPRHLDGILELSDLYRAWMRCLGERAYERSQVPSLLLPRDPSPPSNMGYDIEKAFITGVMPLLPDVQDNQPVLRFYNSTY